MNHWAPDEKTMPPNCNATERWPHKNCNRISHFHRSFLCVLLWAKGHLLRPPCGLYFKWLTTSMASFVAHMPQQLQAKSENFISMLWNFATCHSFKVKPNYIIHLGKIHEIVLRPTLGLSQKQGSRAANVEICFVIKVSSRNFIFFWFLFHVLPKFFKKEI